jgi:hypothetical protein
MGIIVLVMPYLFTRHSFIGVDFTETGQIGDTLGGITTPFIGIISIFLLVKTLSEQQKFNQKQVEKDDFVFAETVSSNIIKACKTIKCTYYLKDVHKENTDNGTAVLIGLMGNADTADRTITADEFLKIHLDIMYIASLYSFWCENMAKSSLSPEMINGLHNAINSYIGPGLSYLKRYENNNIPLIGCSISAIAKKQAKQMLNKVSSSLTLLKTLKPAK